MPEVTMGREECESLTVVMTLITWLVLGPSTRPPDHMEVVPGPIKAPDRRAKASHSQHQGAR